ncbi:hypothetical protein GW17_00058152 [Ensete ventricosum]|nr:hypothetical protein GW17_00058152 [Ensete ventricosum]
MPDKAPLMAKLVFRGGDFDQDSGGPKRFEKKRSRREVVVFNGCDDFDRTVGTTLHRAMPSSVFRVSISKVDDRKYDAQNNRCGLRPSVFGVRLLRWSST